MELGFNRYTDHIRFMHPRALIRSACAIATVWSVLGGDLVIPSGTKVACRLEQTLSSATADAGEQIQFVVTQNVKVNGEVVIPHGSACLGSIVIATARRNLGRSGKLNFSVESVRASDGELIPLRYTTKRKAGEGKGMSTGVMTAGAAMFFWPAAPIVLMRKGKDVTINKGLVLEVFTDTDHALTPRSANSPVGTGAAPAQSRPFPANAEIATVTIHSDIPDADVELESSFIGNTPSTIKLHPGMHAITVKSGSLVWSRVLNVQPGATINVKATLDPRPAGKVGRNSVPAAAPLL